MKPSEDYAGATPPAAWGGDDPRLPFADLPEDAPIAEEADEPPGRSFADDLRDLAADAQTLFEAEKAYQAARASYAIGRGKGVAIRLAVAGALVYFALVALVVGLLLALAPLITPWGALAVVTLGLALAAYFIYRVAMARLRRMRGVLRGEGAALSGGEATS